MSSSSKHTLSRRDFLRRVSELGASGLLAASVLTAPITSPGASADENTGAGLVAEGVATKLWPFWNELGDLSISAGQYIRVSPDLELYYEEAGTGTPLIFIPGWAGTTEFYTHQMAHFANNYRALTYDPRSHGRSSKTLENNHYTQHGQDLKAFIDALKLKDVVLVALSWGCLDIYAYLRAFGPDNLKACIFIDEMPRAVAAQPGDWADFVDLAVAADFINAAVYDLRGLITSFIPPMFQREMRPDELDWALDQLLKTPNYVAALLAVDGSFADYTAEARLIDDKIPVLNVVSEAQAEAAKVWLENNAPHSEVVVLGNHLMLLEFPDQFNAAVGAFLDKVK